NVVPYLLRSKRAKVEADLQTVTHAVNVYAMTRSLPSEADFPKLWEGPKTERLLEEKPVDPWGHDLVYRKRSEYQFVVFSKGEDGLPDTDDDISSDKMKD